MRQGGPFPHHALSILGLPAADAEKSMWSENRKRNLCEPSHHRSYRFTLFYLISSYCTAAFNCLLSEQHMSQAALFSHLSLWVLEWRYRAFLQHWHDLQKLTFTQLCCTKKKREAIKGKTAVCLLTHSVGTIIQSFEVSKKCFLSNKYHQIFLQFGS